MTGGRGGRERQLNYSSLQPLMSDEESRRTKAGKIIAVLEHFLGSLDGKTVVDLGCSTGIIAEAIAERGARVIGLDIDELGLASARRQRERAALFAAADGEMLPVRTGAADVVVFNHIYEHLVDPVPVVAEITRVLARSGVAYLGLGNRLGVVEPHYRLPFLSWLPRPLADAWVRRTGRADGYHERFLVRGQLERLFSGFRLWDYSLTIVTNPGAFGATDIVQPRAGRAFAALPLAMQRAALLLLPTYVWIGALSDAAPQSRSSVQPTRLRLR